MRTVFLDIDTQFDFLYPAGALHVPGAEHLVPSIAKLNSYATTHGHALLSTVDAHTEDDPEFRVWPHHCVVGTFGQQKPSVTLVGQRIVTKKTVDCFAGTQLTECLDNINAERYIVYGVVTEICVKNAAMGALGRGGRVEIVTDATAGLSNAAIAETLRDFTARGGFLTTLDQLTV